MEDETGRKPFDAVHKISSNPLIWEREDSQPPDLVGYCSYGHRRCVRRPAVHR